MNKRKGFTIIEVVLVLAIAGLIFLMVFIALPALQRSQRNAGCKNNLTVAIGLLQNYKSNNRGVMVGFGPGREYGFNRTTGEGSDHPFWGYYINSEMSDDLTFKVHPGPLVEFWSPGSVTTNSYGRIIAFLNSECIAPSLSYVVGEPVLRRKVGSSAIWTILEQGGSGRMIYCQDF